MKWIALKKIMRGPKPKWLACAAVFAGVTLVSPAFGLTLAEVNKRPISDAAVNETLQLYLRQIGHEKLSSVRMAALRKEVLKKLIEEELLYQDGLENHLSVSEAEIEAGVLKILGRFESAEAFDEALSKEALNVEDLRKGVSRAIVIQKSWEGFSSMPESDRVSRLREMTQQADIQIYEDPARVSAGHE